MRGFTRTVTCLVIALFFAAAWHGGAAAQDGLPPTSITILAPSNNQRIEGLPVTIRIRAPQGGPQGLQVLLNGNDISRRLAYRNGVGTLVLNTASLLRLGPGLGEYAANSLIVRQAGKEAASTRFLMNASLRQTVNSIAPGGGRVDLADVGSVTMRPATFGAAVRVTLATTATHETAVDFTESAFIFDARNRLSYEVRIATQDQKPRRPVNVAVSLPPGYLGSLPADAEVKVFTQIYQTGGQSILDNFELLDARLSPDRTTISTVIPVEAFTDRRNLAGRVEAVVIVATTPTKPGSTTAALPTDRGPVSETPQVLPRGAVPVVPPPAGRQAGAAPAATCEGTRLAAPLKVLRVTSAFNGRNHFGTDYAAANGAAVMSMSDGVIERIKVDERPLKVPDPRSRKLVKGYGLYVVVRHTDGSRTLYGHLQKTSVEIGDKIAAGQPIALSNNSGGSSGPHLHVEYAPNGQIFAKASKVDPHACVGTNLKGSVTVADNGSAADDAFRVVLNGNTVCETEIGASNTCAIGNLRSGTITLTLVCTIAPDNVGTYAISLSDGLKFTDGSLSKSGSLTEGGAVAFKVIVP